MGFGAIQGLNNSGSIGPFTSTTTNKASFLYIAPDGTRRELGLNTTTGLYESYDSSWLDFNATSKVLRSTDGTKITFGESVTANGDYQFLPTEIKDRQGNFLTIVYKTLSNNDRVMDYLLDTTGRRIDFYYEANRLREVRQDRNGTLYKYLILNYQPVMLNMGAGNIQEVYVPTRLTYPTGVNYRLYYTSYSHVWMIEKWVPGISGQGTARRVAYTMFREASVNNVSTPVHSQSWQSIQFASSLYSGGGSSSARTDWAENRANGVENMTDYYYKEYGGGVYQSPYGHHDRVAVQGTQGLVEMYTTSNANATTPHQMIWWKSSAQSPSLKSNDLVWEKDSGVSWRSNVRVKEMTISDNSWNSHWTKTTYSLIDGIRLPTQVDEAK